MTTSIGEDRGHLARAIAVATSVQGRTSPNPGVGCVLVRDRRVVGEGASEPAGGRHAEVVALARAGEASRGATAYVTLEPCAHTGRTAPCADALVAAGIERVVIGRPDPNPVAAGGRERLASAGLQVVGPLPDDDLLAVAIAGQLEGFLSVVTRGRPHVTLKLAQTADGQLTAPPPARWITSPAARRAVHRWRAACDAVLVGAGTVVADDPQLDVRHVTSPRSPRPVVLDGRLRTPAGAHVVRRRALVLTRPDAPIERRKALVAGGAEVVDVPAANPGGVELVAALERIAESGLSSVFAEPGGTLARALLAGGLVDRLVLHVALGVGDGAPHWAVDPPETDQGWMTERLGGVGPDLVVHRRAVTPRQPSEIGS